jgi:hypothetical protein
MTGVRSTKLLKPKEWAPYLDELARLAGEPSTGYSRPPASGLRPPMLFPLGNAATPDQLAYVPWLCEELRLMGVWRHADGPDVAFRHWAAKHCFGPVKKQSVERDAWIDNRASLASLSRKRVHIILTALQKYRASERAARAAAALVAVASVPRKSLGAANG